MERVVNIIGMGISSQDVPDTGENWIINLAYKRLKGKKIQKMFFFDDLFNELLPQDNFAEPVDYKFDNFLADNPDVEIISKFNTFIKKAASNDESDKKEIKEYPLNLAMKLASGGYFTSTAAYVICYAILEKVDRIRLYGFELWSGGDFNEYEYQKPCMDFWIAFAISRGIKVEVPYMLMQNVQNKQNYYGFKSGDLIQNYRR